MTKLTTWLAHVGVCVALALPIISARPQAADATSFTASGAIAAGGPERLYQARTGNPDGAALRCLTEALYFEARGESPAGQRAVAEVISVSRQVATASAQIVDEAGKIYATATTTCLILRGNTSTSSTPPHETGQ